DSDAVCKTVQRLAPTAARNAVGPKKPSSNELAFALLKAKAGDVVYCEPGQVLNLPGLSNARAYVLGPPRTAELLKKDRPTKVRGEAEDEGKPYEEVYLSGGANTIALALSPVLGLDKTASGRRVHDDSCYPFQDAYRQLFKIEKGGKFQWSDDSNIA